MVNCGNRYSSSAAAAACRRGDAGHDCRCSGCGQSYCPPADTCGCEGAFGSARGRGCRYGSGCTFWLLVGRKCGRHDQHTDNKRCGSQSDYLFPSRNVSHYSSSNAYLTASGLSRGVIMNSATVLHPDQFFPIPFCRILGKLPPLGDNPPAHSHPVLMHTILVNRFGIYFPRIRRKSTMNLPDTSIPENWWLNDRVFPSFQ